jgi:CTP synthase (UTP-ammonia lyase)
MAIAIVGDHNPSYPTHQFTDEVFAYLGVDTRWLPTPAVGDDPKQLDNYDGVLISPGSPYVSMQGALAAIQYARENDVPLLGNCGGFQHVVIEYARNVLGVENAEHAETSPDADELVVVPLACSLVGQQQQIEIRPDTLAARLYHATESTESFYCSYGLNSNYRGVIEDGGVRFSGFDHDGEPRILELPDHRFFLATLYVPQASSSRKAPHPLLVGFIEACQV